MGARYFFDTLDGEHVIDQDGEVLPDKGTAREIATRIVAELTPSPDLWCGEPFKVILRDENNHVVGSLTVTATRGTDAEAESSMATRLVSAWPLRSLVYAMSDPSPVVMRTSLTKEDQDLDRLWREMFGEPMPILGAGDIVRQILEEAQRNKARRPEGRQG